MINNLKEISDSIDLINTLSLLIPEGTEENLDVNGININVSKKDGNIKIKATTKPKSFNDSEVKEAIKKYQKNIEDLNDDLFVDALEEIKEHIDVKEFNELLKLDHFTEKEANKVLEMIEGSSKIIRSYLQEEITDLVELYDRF